jgi:hypothetical protein
MLLSMWNSLPAKEAWNEFTKEFKFTTRTQGSFSQKYTTMLREMHVRTGQQGYQVQEERREHLTSKSPALAYEFLSPMFITVGTKHYLAHSKKHFKSIQSGPNEKGTNTLFHDALELTSVGDMVRFNLVKLNPEMSASWKDPAANFTQQVSLNYPVPTGFRAKSWWEDEHLKGVELTEKKDDNTTSDGFDLH